MIVMDVVGDDVMIVRTMGSSLSREREITRSSCPDSLKRVLMERQKVMKDIMIQGW